MRLPTQGEALKGKLLMSKMVIKNIIKRVLIAESGTLEYFLGQISSSDIRDLTFVPVIAEEANLRRGV